MSKKKAKRARVSVSATDWRRAPSETMKLALDGEVAILGDNGEVRLLITRNMEPLE